MTTRAEQAEKRRRAAASRASSIKRLYGLSPADLDALGRAARGRCMGCRKRSTVRALNIDHDHRYAAGQRASVRGLLCSRCNRFLGYIRDDPIVLIRLAMYLVDPPVKKILMRTHEEG